MTPNEFDQYLDDLETRLERLRSLYEQYFMGMERIEPSVARKDVDRRFWLLRREKVRNTARRFKLQTLVQRYNTLQQYWHRTCREIEQGTYRRHKLKAERAFGIRSAETPAREKSAPPPAPTEKAERSRQATRSAEEDLRALLASDFDPAAEVDAALDAIFSPAPAPRVAPGPPSEVRATAPPTGSPATGALQATKLAPRPTSPGTPPRAPEPRPRPPTAPPRPAPPPAPRPHVAPGGPARGSAPSRGPAPPPRPTPPPSRAPAPPPPRPLPTPPPAPPRPAAPRTSSDSGSLSDARIRELHHRYLAARTGAAPPMSLDKLAQSLRATEQKLRQQHRGRRVDFDIVVRDGKPVIKPKLT